MSGGIRVSKKHGVNPTLAVCFWCGEDEGSLALLGHLPGDAEAPRRMVLGYDPCAKCKEQWALGVVLIEVREEPLNPGQPSISGKVRELYPTGRYIVVTDGGARRIFDGEAAEQLVAKRKGFINADAFAMIAPTGEAS